MDFNYCPSLDSNLLERNDLFFRNCSKPYLHKKINIKMRMLFVLLLSVVLLASCQTDSAKAPAVETMDAATLSKKIAETRNQIYNEKDNKFDSNKAMEYIQYCQSFATVAPQDPEAAKYLFQAAETARSIKKYNRALAIYDQIYNNFSSYPKAPQAMFLKAFTLDSEMQQYDKAKVLYEEFMAKHPQDEFADDTKFLLENLGKSDEEIIKQFEEQQAKMKEK